MNKNIRILFVIVFCIGIIVGIVFGLKNKNKKEDINNKKISTNTNIENMQNEPKGEKLMNKINIEVNEKTLIVELEDNPSAEALVEKLKDGDIVIQAQEYGNFEKVGSLGLTLPREDENITTEAGDLVLYQGNQISLFYNSNSWSYTKLGKVSNVSKIELKNILGDGDVIMTLKIR